MPNQADTPNPYAGSRNHEDGKPMDRDDVLAVAGLLGQVTGALGDIDNKNVGGQNQFVQAKKIDPKQALTNIARAHGIVENGAPVPTGHPPPVNTPQVPAGVSQTPVAPPIPPVSTQVPSDTIEKRLRDLEVIVESYKKILKFKRGISYSISTTTMKGEFKDPVTLLDLISTEMAKNTKTITLKLVDASKPKK